jgi:uncharacterized membrane protein HdeD (DUF308 family)
LTDADVAFTIEESPQPMRLDVETARRMILFVAGVYILLVGAVEIAKHLGTEPEAANDLLQQMTTIASLTVGTIIGFYLASRKRHS